MPYRCYTREHLLVDLGQMVLTQRQKGTFGEVGECIGLDGGNAVAVEVNLPLTVGGISGGTSVSPHWVR